MTSNVRYLVRDSSELQDLEEKIGKLSNLYLFNCNPIEDKEILNSSIIARKRTGCVSDYIVSPYPNCELSITNLERDLDEKLVFQRGDSESVTLSIGPDNYTIFYNYTKG